MLESPLIADVFPLIDVQIQSFVHDGGRVAHQMEFEFCKMKNILD